ncbi:ras-domain-containing protein [Parathielavia hyrcaniae]|uniref:Ras-domain-containing protein n=1 Tax=Parathielavia hyrcaniae TaxID=113614 RepID=A0AAN6Q535_9PEZI|nr:ras-domain-containing protein [Parathielavia hyrcaniae]
MSSSLEAKIVVLGAQGVGKTSLVMRYCKGAFVPSQTTSTVGASFLTKRVVDTDTDTTVRLQIWDTAGQERFRSISRLYYRGANACILCYSITDAASFAEMGIWLTELRRNLPPDIVLHVVGTKADIVARDPSRREVPFERCIAYVAENLNPGMGSTPPPTAGAGFDNNNNNNNPTNNQGQWLGSQQQQHHQHQQHQQQQHSTSQGSTAAQSWLLQGNTGVGMEPRSPSSKRSSGFWGQEVGWDACHEISAESGEGVEEVFRVVTRKLVEQNRKMQAALLAAAGSSAGGPDTPGTAGYGFGYGNGSGGGGGGGGGFGGSGSGGGYGGDGGGAGGYFDGPNARGSFRVGRDRRSWLFSPGFSPVIGGGGGGGAVAEEDEFAQGGEGRVRKRGCC